MLHLADVTELFMKLEKQMRNKLGTYIVSGNTAGLVAAYADKVCSSHSHYSWVGTHICDYCLLFAASSISHVEKFAGAHRRTVRHLDAW